MNRLLHNGFEIIIPKPLFVVVEDVGWWQGQDGSSAQQPFRTGMVRNHHPRDYEALATLAEQLSMRILLGMVTCEWDLVDYLQNVPGATWMGESWNNQINRGPWLEEAADCLRNNQGRLEIAVHGVGHEFWQGREMNRAEFHDSDCRMRSPEVIRAHLDAFGEILNQHKLGPFPRSFIPPALKHSFGNGPDSFQAILQEYGVRFVSTGLSRARRFSSPLAQNMTWEENVLLLDRGISPVPWHAVAAQPEKQLNGPLIALHWANLLHQDPERNLEVVNAWISSIRQCADEVATLLAPDVHSCWSQYCHQQLAQLVSTHYGVMIDRKSLPPSSYQVEQFSLRVRYPGEFKWTVIGGRVLTMKKEEEGVCLLELEAGEQELCLQLIAG